MACGHTNSKGVTYYLNKKEVTLRGGKPQTIYFFTKTKGSKGTPCDLPEGSRRERKPTQRLLDLRKKKA